MLKNEMNPKRSPRRRLTILFFLVAFVFTILLVSMVIAAGFLYLMNILGLMQPLSDNRFPAVLAFLLIVSLVVCILMTIVAGNISLRPFKKLIEATKEIAGGNFDVRVEERGPDEFKRLISGFNEMAAELGSIETLRNDFISNISHEFKTPLVSIRGFVKLLKKGNLTEEQREEYMDIILSETDRLTALSSNVLLLSKLQNTIHITDRTAFYLDEQLRRVILLLDPQLSQKGLALDIDLHPLQIRGNEEMLQHVWINLLTNAIKFTPAGGNIRLELKDNSSYGEVVVRDTGIGMDKETCDHIFDKFFQGNASRSTDGNGLGLSLVKRILDLHDGTIEVESEPGEGSQFRVTLPIQ